MAVGSSTLLHTPLHTHACTLNCCSHAAPLFHTSLPSPLTLHFHPFTHSPPPPLSTSPPHNSLLQPLCSAPLRSTPLLAAHHSHHLTITSLPTHTLLSLPTPTPFHSPSQPPVSLSLHSSLLHLLPATAHIAAAPAHLFHTTSPSSTTLPSRHFSQLLSLDEAFSLTSQIPFHIATYAHWALHKTANATFLALRLYQLPSHWKISNIERPTQDGCAETKDVSSPSGVQQQRPLPQSDVAF